MMNVNMTGDGLLRSLNRGLFRITRVMAMISGALFLLLAVYMTIDVISRRLGGPFTGVADEVAAYTLAFSGTWAFAYALADGTHVRIDLVLHRFSENIQKILNFWTFVFAAAFAAVLAWQMWGITFESIRIGAIPSGSLLVIPLAYPQGFVAFGLSIFVLQAILSSMEALSDFVLHIREGKISEQNKVGMKVSASVLDND